MSKTPKLRFKEFTEKLEHYKFKDLVLLQRGSSPRPISKYVTNSEDGVNWIKIGDVSKDSTFIYKTKEKITQEGAKKSRFVGVGDLILSNSMSFGRPYIMGIEGYIHDGWFVLKNYSDNFDRDYLCNLLTSDAIQKQYKRLAAGGVVDNISSELVNSVDINLPSKEEQEKISSFFSLIDDKISLQSEKVEALKDYKRGMMQKIFSRELRFKDDEGRDYPEWEKKKITEVAKTSIGLVTTMTENYVENGVKLIRNSDIKENKIKKDNLINLDIEFAAQNEHRKLKINDVVTVHTGEIGTSAVIDEDMDGCLGFATLNTRPDNNIIDSHYLCHYFNSFRNKKYAIRMSTGDGRSNYNLKDFNNANILIPCIEEQKKIVNLLSNIDLKLDKEQEKLDYLNKYKKGLLQQMFV